MSIDSKIIEILKEKIHDEGQNLEIFEILHKWLLELDDGKLDLDQDEKIKTILDRLNVRSN